MSIDSISIFEDNLNLAYYLANKHCGSIDLDDAIQAALLGLWKATRSYDESKGFKFCTFATACIYNEIKMEVRRQLAQRKLEKCSLDEINYIVAVSDDVALDKVLEEEALKYLKERDFTAYIITLYYRENYSQQQICKILQLSQGYISRKLIRAKKIIKEWMEIEK